MTARPEWTLRTGRYRGDYDFVVDGDVLVTLHIDPARLPRHSQAARLMLAAAAGSVGGLVSAEALTDPSSSLSEPHSARSDRSGGTP